MKWFLLVRLGKINKTFSISEFHYKIYSWSRFFWAYNGKRIFCFSLLLHIYIAHRIAYVLVNSLVNQGKVFVYLKEKKNHKIFVQFATQSKIVNLNRFHAAIIILIIFEMTGRVIYFLGQSLSFKWNNNQSILVAFTDF